MFRYQFLTALDCAIVGESGCGKTTLARTIAMLSPPTGGDVIFDGRNLTKEKIGNRECYRHMQMVFQDPASSLDPRLTIRQSIAEPLSGLFKASTIDVDKTVQQSLLDVGLNEGHAERRPAHLSGGQKQRVAIARAIAPKPKFVILDEPTSSLDVSVQAQILNLLLDLQSKYGLTYLLITHNIAVAEYLADYVAVMYSGKIVESGPARAIIKKPRHPYTISLIKAAPIANPWIRNLLSEEISGEVPSALNPPSGCRFNPRCQYATEVCVKTVPPMRTVSEGQDVACHHVERTA